MSVIFIDGMDKYGPAGQTTPTVASLLTAGEWTTAAGATVVTGLSGTGQALALGAIGDIRRTLASNYGRIIGGIRISPTLTGVTGFIFGDGGIGSGQYQFSLKFNGTGTFSIMSGGLSSTIIATSTATVTANSVHFLEWDVTIGTAGAYQVWLDGASILSGTGNTRGGTSNNWINVFAASSSSSGMTIDDLYLFDATGTTCNAPLLNNPVVETAFPNADTATKAWINGASIIGVNNSTTATTNAPGANQVFLRQFTASANMTLNSMSCVPMATSGTAKFRPVIYGAVGPTGAHRYWRISINTTGGGTPNITEFQFRSTVGTPLLFSGGTPSSSGGSAPANASDNNGGTACSITGPPGWWAYDYGAGNTITVNEVTVLPFGTSSAPTNFDLHYSDDGVTWLTVANFTASWSTTAVQAFNVTTRPTTPVSPGSALIAQGNEVTGATSGATLTASFSSGVALTVGTAYAIGFITDTSVALQQSDTLAIGVKAANTYASGAPATLPTPTTAQASWALWGNCTGSAADWPSVSTNPPVDDVAYVYETTVGDEELFAFPALATAPASVACVAYKARLKRSDSGARTVDVRCASGAADTAGTASSITPGTSYAWVGNYQATDPNTGVAWTGTGVNAATGGVRVAS